MQNVGTYFVENFGCRATQADGAAIERQLRDRGLSRAASPGDAEVVVLNTCTVTASADQDIRSAIRRIHRDNPETKILVTGCYAQRAPEEISALPGVSLVIGNSHKHEVASYAAPHGRLAGVRATDRHHRRLKVQAFLLVTSSPTPNCWLRLFLKVKKREARPAPISRCRMAVTTAARSASSLGSRTQPVAAAGARYSRSHAILSVVAIARSCYRASISAAGDVT